MRNICKWIGLLSIAVTFILPLAFFVEQISLATMKLALLISTLVWFGTSVFWSGRKSPEDLASDSLLCVSGSLSTGSDCLSRSSCQIEYFWPN